VTPLNITGHRSATVIETRTEILNPPTYFGKKKPKTQKSVAV